jgi:hypothetical protein
VGDPLLQQQLLVPLPLLLLLALPLLLLLLVLLPLLVVPLPLLLPLLLLLLPPLLLLLLLSLTLLLHLPLHICPSSLLLAGWLPCLITIHLIAIVSASTAVVVAVAIMHTPALPLTGPLICVCPP